MRKQKGLVSGLRDQIVDEVRNDIVAGRLQIGARVSELQLMERFGVSRAPIREALVRLADEGLVVSRPNCGVTVAPLPVNAIQELIIPIRRTIETYALKQILDTVDEDDFRNWEQLLGRLKEACAARDYETTAELDIQFHRSILECTGDTDLLSIWSCLVGRLRQHFWESHREFDDLMEIYNQHRELVDLFRTRDLAAVIRALDPHIV